MHALSIAIILLILGVWLFMAVMHFYSAKKETGWNRLLLFLAPFLLAIGALGFFGSGLSSIGGLNWLPHSFEWPVGVARGVVTTPDHFFVVPHTPSGRVQIYDSNWKFIRGWHVDAGGGTFRLFLSDGSQIHVITARGHWHYIFGLDGSLLSKANYPSGSGSYDSFPKEGTSYTIPTPPWLWVFTSPGWSWLAAMVGMLMLALKDKISRRTKKRPTPT